MVVLSAVWDYVVLEKLPVELPKNMTIHGTTIEVEQ